MDVALVENLTASLTSPVPSAAASWRRAHLLPKCETQIYAKRPLVNSAPGTEKKEQNP